MKKILTVGMALGAVIGIIYATFVLIHNPVQAQVGPSALSRVAGVYNSVAYGPGKWGAVIITGNTATGSQTDGSCRVTTTITTSTAWLVGISGTTNSICTSNSTLTAGTTGIANMNSPATVGTTTGLTAILITTTVSNPGAGAVHVKAWGYTAAQSTF